MSGSRVQRLVWAGLCVVFGVSALVALLGVHLVEITRTKQLLPPDEFPAARFFFDHEAHSFAIVLGCAVLFAIGAALLLRSRGPIGRAGLVAAAVGQGMLPFVGWGALVAMAGIFTVFLSDAVRRLESHPARDAIAGALDGLVRLTPRRLLAAWPELLGVPALAVCFAIGVEFVVFTRPMAIAFAEPGDLWRFLGLALSSAALTGARFALELLLALLVARALVARSSLPRVAGLALVTFLLIMSTASAWGGLASMVGFVLLVHVLLARAQHPATGLLALPLVAGLYMFARTTDLGFAAAGGLVNAAEMLWAILVLFGAFVLPMTLWAHAGFVRAVAERPEASPAGLIRALAGAILSPIGRPGLLTVVPYLALMVWFLAVLNYPEFVDYAEVGQRAYSPILMLAAITAAVLVYLSLGRRWLNTAAGRAFVAVGFGLAIAAQVAWSERNVLRMIGERYTTLAQHAIQWVDPLPPDLPGPDDAPPVAFAHQATLPEAPPRYRERRPPIVFILWDAVRADHMSVYGYSRPTTPNIEALAAESAVFERALASATATTVSLRHIFTGRYSSRYAEDLHHPPFFTGRLVAAGYDAIYVNAAGSDLNGVSPQSFTRNHASPAVARATTPFPEYHEPAKVRRALELIDERPSDSFFLFLHFLAPHFPWDHQDEVPDFGEDRIAKYDENIAYADYWTGVLLDGLRERGLYDDAVILITADHGTGLGDHGLWGAFQPYEEQIAVPLVIRAPGLTPSRVQAAVSGIDLAPTLVSLFEPGAPNPYHGTSLLQAMAGDAIDRRYLFSMAAFQDAVAVTDLERSLRLHVYRKDRYLMLFDLAADPGETRNLADTDPQRTRTLLDVVNAWEKLGEGQWDVPWVYEEPPTISWPWGD